MQEKRHAIRTIWPILFFLLFAIVLIGLTYEGARGYEHMQESSQQRFTETTAMDYLKTKVREADGEGRVKIGTYLGQDALILKDGDGYETILYCYDGTLRELYKAEDTELSLSSGSEILALDSFTVEKYNEKALSFTVEYQGEVTQAYILVKSGVTEDEES